jgi:hypothetical protein
MRSWDAGGQPVAVMPPGASPAIDVRYNPPIRSERLIKSTRGDWPKEGAPTDRKARW